MASENLISPQRREQATDIYSKNRTHDTTLTPPLDKVGVMPPNPREADILTSDQYDAVKEYLYDTSGMRVPLLERRLNLTIPCKRAVLIQTFGLYSWTPAKGASPDAEGVYGGMKLIGNYEDMQDADDRANEVIREEDSYNIIRTCRVGQCTLLITPDSKYNLDGDNRNIIDINKKVKDVIREDVKAKRADEAKEIEEIKERESNLQDEVDRENTDEKEVYTTLNTKLAQLSWTYIETAKKMAAMKETIINTRSDIATMREENESVHTNMYQRFMDARAKCGIPQDDKSFIKYFVMDASEELGF
ncbi:MAG: hypothetical protein JKX76_00860 [Colwellia sp.]|nr:hypothetical protein [Colwellia sp.]